MEILVVEDDHLVAFGLEALLEDAGHTVMGPANSHAEAVEVVEAHSPELALIDIDLDYHGAGLDLARRFVAQDIGVIFVSGRPEAARSTRTGAIGLIAKPYDSQIIVAAIEFFRHRLLGEAVRIPRGLEVFAARR